MISKPLTILIGGAPRTGKSLLAASLFRSLSSPVIHGDTLVNAMKNNYPGSFGVQLDDLALEDYAARMEPIQLFLKKIIRNMGKDISYPAKIFESCYLHPQVAARLAQEGPVIAVFIIYGDFDMPQRIADIRNYAKTNQQCWSHEHDDSSLARSLMQCQKFSDFLRIQCQQHGIEWIDIENDWVTRWYTLRDELLERAQLKLLSCENMAW